MKTAGIQLHLKGHCIETAAKNEFHRLMDDYFTSSGDRVDPFIEEKLELLREFLDESDFPGLRASDERLAGVREGTVQIVRDAQGKPELKNLTDCDCKDHNHVIRSKLLRLFGWWSIFAGGITAFSICPICGQAGCPIGVGTTGIIAGLFALVKQYGTYFVKFFKRRPYTKN